jgi:hypothetical protein
MQKCGHCQLEFPTALPECPHCGLPRLFPNVAAARDEQPDLDARYKESIRAARQTGSEAQLRKFETWAARSAVVINRTLPFVAELADATGIFGTFYKKRDSGMLIPQGSKWEGLRAAADEFLFGQNKAEIRFGALSGDGAGLPNYGECTMTLADRFVSHRTSFFETNTARFFERGGMFQAGALAMAPRGMRALWEDRDKLATAKLAPQITPTTTDAEFPRILLSPGSTSDDDEYIEAHIYGPLTIHSFASVTLPKSSRRLSPSAIKGLAQKLATLNIASPSSL